MHSGLTPPRAHADGASSGTTALIHLAVGSVDTSGTACGALAKSDEETTTIARVTCEACLTWHARARFVGHSLGPASAIPRLTADAAADDTTTPLTVAQTIATTRARMGCGCFEGDPLCKHPDGLREVARCACGSVFFTTEATDAHECPNDDEKSEEESALEAVLAQLEDLDDDGALRVLAQAVAARTPATRTAALDAAERFAPMCAALVKLGVSLSRLDVWRMGGNVHALAVAGATDRVLHALVTDPNDTGAAGWYARLYLGEMEEGTPISDAPEPLDALAARLVTTLEHCQGCENLATPIARTR